MTNTYHNRPESKESERYNATLSISLDILDYIGTSTNGVTIAEISRELSLNKSRVMRLCGTLCMKGYLCYDAKTGLYHLGIRLLALGKAYEHQTNAVNIIREVLGKMENRLGETVSFHILQNEKRFCLCAVEGHYELRYVMKEGAESDYPYGSIWKVLLAFGTEELREKVYSGAPYTPETPYSAVTKEDIQRIVEKTQELGYCLSVGDHDVGAIGLSSPVFSGRRFIGVICLSGLSERMSKEYINRAIPYIKENCTYLGTLLEEAHLHW